MANLSSTLVRDTAADVRATLDGSKMFAKSIVLVTQIDPTVPVPGMFRWVAGSASADNNASQLIIVPTTGGGSGRWVRCDPKIDILLPFTFATADRAVLLSLPTELTLSLLLEECIWEITTSFAGGAGSRIGLSIGTGPVADTNGSLMGGAAGDGIGATPVLNSINMWKPTAGVGGGSKSMALRTVGDTILFNRITSVFTAGVGIAHVPANLISNAITPPPP